MWQLLPWRLAFPFFWFPLICVGSTFDSLLTCCDKSTFTKTEKVTGLLLLSYYTRAVGESGPNVALTWKSPYTYEPSWPMGPDNPHPHHPVEKAACVRMKGCICWPVCVLSQGLGDYVDKRCTWCFRLSFSPPLPPFIRLPSPSLLLLWPFPTFSPGLLKD